MVVEVEDVLLLRPGVDVAELGEVANVAVMHVRRVFREKRFGCPQVGSHGDICRDVNQHGRVAHGEGGEEELLVSTPEAVSHWPDAQPVRDDLGADPAGAVVDHERVAYPVQGGLQWWCRKEVKRLDRRVLVVPDGGELPEGLEAVGHGGVPKTGSLEGVRLLCILTFPAAVKTGPRDDGVHLRVEGLDGVVAVAVDRLDALHVQHRLGRFPLLAPYAVGNKRECYRWFGGIKVTTNSTQGNISYSRWVVIPLTEGCWRIRAAGAVIRVEGLVVDDRLVEGCMAGRGQAQLLFRHHAAVVSRSGGLHVHPTEGAHARVPARRLAAKRCAMVRDEKRSLVLGVEEVCNLSIGGNSTSSTRECINQAAGVGPHV